MNRIIYISTFYLLMSLTVQAQKFVASVSKNTVAVGEQFKLSFKLDAKGDNFRPPNLQQFRVYSGPNQSSSMKWVNGVVSNATTYSYVLSPKTTGELSIGSASISFDGNSYSSQPIKIKAVKAKQQAQQAKSQQPGTKSQSSQNTNQIEQNVFLRAQVSNASPYEGEQVVVTYKLYYRIDVINIEAEKLPAFSGFSSYDVELKNNNLPQEVVNGIRYNVAAIQQKVLFPQRAGELIIDPLKLNTVVRIQSQRRSRSIFDQFFGSYQDVRYSCKSQALKLKVKALPKSGRPDDFSGAVGSYKFSAEIDRDSLGANDALNLTTKIAGRGDIQLLPEPKFEFPPDFEVYDPKTNTNSNVSSGGIRGNKAFEYLVIPRHSGIYEIESKGFNYFDPVKAKYVVVEPKVWQIKVGEVDEDDISTFRASKKEDIKFVGKDIRYIKTDEAELSEKGDRFFRSSNFWLMLLASPILMSISLFIMKRLNKTRSDIGLMKKRRAGSVANKHLKEAQKALNLNSDKVYEEISVALNGYLSNKLGIQTSELSRDHIREVLSDRKMSQDLIAELAEVLDRCDMARFAPGGETDKKELFERSKALIHKLEEQIS